MTKNGQKWPKMTKYGKKCLKIFQSVHCPTMFQSVYKCPKVLKNVSKFPQMSRNVKKSKKNAYIIYDCPLSIDIIDEFWITGGTPKDLWTPFECDWNA